VVVHWPETAPSVSVPPEVSMKYGPLQGSGVVFATRRAARSNPSLQNRNANRPPGCARIMSIRHRWRVPKWRRPAPVSARPIQAVLRTSRPSAPSITAGMYPRRDKLDQLALWLPHRCVYSSECPLLQRYNG
jgi:hypothetical protein